jgi:uncharacterized short protein YbdD (DUF466 family)
MSLRESVVRAWRAARQLGRSVIGVPDYDAYLRHCREHHAGREPMTYAEFFTDRQGARYKGTGGRCC